jgi:hypothetical protein
VLEKQLFAEFAAAIRAEAAEKLAELPPDTPLAARTALAEVMLGYLEEAGAVSSHDPCPHEDTGVRRPCRIVGYSLPEDSTRLDLFTAHAVPDGGPQTLPPSELSSLSGWAARFFEYAAKGDHARFEGNPAAAAAAAQIHADLKNIEDVRIHVLTDARVGNDEVMDLEILGRVVETEVWDLNRLYKAAGDEYSRERITVDFTALMGRPIACLEMRPPPDEYQTFLLILPGPVIFDLYERYGAKLFEYNVRSFLQAKGAVNKGMRKTLDETPGRFLAYNNGLTATADRIEVGMWHGETVIHNLQGLQIVNGAQTTASIHRARKVDKLDIKNVAVSMKLTLVPGQKLAEFVPLIARFANTQNPIQIADLSASDAFQQKFEKLADSTWCPGEKTRWFYERARGSYQVARQRYGTTPAQRREFDQANPKEQHFGKVELAKYLMTWWCEPQTVSRGAQRNYGLFMFGLRERMGDVWEPDKEFYQHTIAQALVFRAAQGVVDKAKLQSYRANVVTYMVARLAQDYGDRIDLDYIWLEQAISPEMLSLFRSWAPVIHKALVDTAEKRNVTEWAKKDACWDILRKIELPEPDEEPSEFIRADLPTEVAAASAPSGPPADDPVVQCMSLDGRAWTRIIAWAASATNVDDYDRDVSHTLSGYALKGWNREPTVKQAIRGARLIAAARKAGVLDAQAA